MDLVWWKLKGHVIEFIEKIQIFQDESYDLVYNWRKILDDFTKTNKTDTK